MAIPGYRILRKIRQGGMSTVYLAIQKSVEREVAIKVMSPSLTSDPSFGSRFYREAKIVGQLSHPNIVSIYDVGSYKHYNYITMDYLPGAPLQDRLEDGISAQDAIRIVREMASALDYAHDRGYIHRDIKPDNILFREDGSAVLCDFGIAKALKGTVKMTNMGSVLGTPNYMSPEQAQGKELDGRADIYSLGVVFYEMLSGQVPFTGDDPVSVAVKHMSSPIPKLPASHKSFQPIIEKMMAKRPGDRFQTGKEVIQALDELETSISNTGYAHLTQTGSTTVQVVSLVGALLASLTTAISLAFKRLMLTKITFKSSTVQLSNKQLEDIDTFIFSEHIDDSEYADLAIIQDTVEQPAITYTNRNLYWFAAVLLIVGVAAYLLTQGSPSYLSSWLDDRSSKEAEDDAVEQHATSIPEPIVTELAPEPVMEEVETVTEVVPEPEPEPEPVPVTEYAFTINTVPPNASVRILNIKPRYTDGMLLPPGAYHVEVSANNYFSERKWLRIKNRGLSYNIELTPTRKLLPVGSAITDKLADGSNGPEMIVLPQGTLSINEGQSTLYLDKAVALSTHEITFADYLKFVDATERTRPNDYDWGKGKRPVIDVSYQDALEYTQWLSTQTGETYRLPTKQEWQYAARSGSSDANWWGDSNASKKANCRRGCDSDYSKLFGSTTAPVGEYTPNAYGLYDTAGNVEEWLAECNNWQDQERTLCISANVAGGSHADRDKDISPDTIRTANATVGSKTIGFRVLLEL